MGSYIGEITNSAQATAKTLGTLTQPASALKRFKITYVSLGSSATADNQNYAQLKRLTASGVSGASVTPTQSDPADGTASGVITAANTSEPTYSGGSLLSPTFHQRATYQWYAQPGHEIVVPVTNNAGVGVFMNTMTSTIALIGVINWEE